MVDEYHRQYRIIEQVRNGGKLMQVNFDQIRFIARWSLARAFPLGRFLNLILAYRGEFYTFNEARHWNILIGGKLSL